MDRQGAPRIAAAAAVAVLAAGAVGVAACGEDDEKRFADERIAAALELEQLEGGQGFAIEGDPFCIVEQQLLNHSAEVEQALDADELGLVITSRQGNAGITAVPPFDPGCGEQVEKRLDELDPEPK